jgi:hypothetical protein
MAGAESDPSGSGCAGVGVGGLAFVSWAGGGGGGISAGVGVGVGGSGAVGFSSGTTVKLGRSGLPSLKFSPFPLVFAGYTQTFWGRNTAAIRTVYTGISVRTEM